MTCKFSSLPHSSAPVCVATKKEQVIHLFYGIVSAIRRWRKRTGRRNARVLLTSVAVYFKLRSRANFPREKLFSGRSKPLVLSFRFPLLFFIRFPYPPLRLHRDETASSPFLVGQEDQLFSRASRAFTWRLVRIVLLFKIASFGHHTVKRDAERWNRFIYQQFFFFSIRPQSLAASSFFIVEENGIIINFLAFNSKIKHPPHTTNLRKSNLFLWRNKWLATNFTFSVFSKFVLT